MTDQEQIISKDIVSYLKTQKEKSFLRFITCGSVDDGKSTLIGRLLYDSKLVYEDQLNAIKNDSKKFGTQGGEIDFALLVDGLAAEREQGITIDVAYKFFSTSKRKFIVADTPGHEQYTRNMATGASTANLAILLIDARHGIQVQTRRHSYIASLLGIKSIVVAINKMDLADYSQYTFNSIEEDFRSFSKSLGFDHIRCIPISALNGDNITTKSERMPWYQGSCLLQHLETVDVNSNQNDGEFRFPVQWVNRPDLNFRGFSGTIASGQVNVGDEIIVIPSGQKSKVKKIVTMGNDLEYARKHQSVTLTLHDEIDISRGDLICGRSHPAQQSNQIQAHILWMAEKHLFPGRGYLLKTINKTVPATVTSLKHKVNVNDFSKEAGNILKLNEVGLCNIYLDEPIAFDPYSNNRQTGSFILIDRQTNDTVGMGVINFSLRRAANIVWQNTQVGKTQRAEQKHQKPVILWFTGLSGSGKSTIANLVERKLFDIGRHTYLLDGDNIRHGLNKDLGFTDIDRVENIRRISETAKLMVDAGLIVLVAFISPFTAERNDARCTVNKDEFVEIYINTSLEEAEKRDVKGLYAKARRGEIKNFTGIDSEYQAPHAPEIEINTLSLSAEEAAMKIIDYLQKNEFIVRTES
ncbi:MAG: sulfate adenylyltransferase subunit CysN [Robiginitomaculum sp.]|nr:sulfate adenylyltransferase subunit CysN [Robiginitomaculum sp.]